MRYQLGAVHLAGEDLQRSPAGLGDVGGTVTDDPWFRFVLGALATWRVAHLLAYEDGPWDIVARLRAALGEGGLGRLLDCFYCLSLWVALPVAFAVASGPAGWVLAWLALSGAAAIIERLAPPPAARLEPIALQGDDNVLLRTGTRVAPRADHGTVAAAADDARAGAGPRP
jgi:hypothetical protein